MENSNVAMFNDKGQVETLTQSQYNYDQRIAVMSADEKAKYLQKTEKLVRHDNESDRNRSQSLFLHPNHNRNNQANKIDCCSCQSKDSRIGLRLRFLRYRFDSL